MKKTSTLIIILVLLVTLLSFLFVLDQQKIQDYKTPNEETVMEDKSVVLSNPKPNQIIESPLGVQGQIKGSWLFEASTSMVLTDWDGRIIAESYIQTSEDWMTTELVPFSGTLEFRAPEDTGDFSDMGSLIIQKANPSGLPENDDAVEIRIKFR